MTIPEACELVLQAM
ncbi:hypothetical protein [Chryseobacterium sp. CH1]